MSGHAAGGEMPQLIIDERQKLLRWKAATR
jgi:hypothetical protein